MEQNIVSKKNQTSKLTAWVNDVVREYVYAPPRMFSAARIMFVALVALFASVAGDAFARHMVPVPAGGGTFVDGYTARYMFEVGAVAFIISAMLARRASRALCAAYVRRLDMDEAIHEGERACCDSNSDTKRSAAHAPSGSVANGDYAASAGDSEGVVGESSGGGE